MQFVDNLKVVSALFKGTFCRSFIVYGSNIIPSKPNSVSIVSQSNPALFEQVSSQYLLDDTISDYLSPSWQYAIDCLYEVDDCKFYVASYWDFRVILAAVQHYVPKLCFRYNTMYDRLNSFMITNPARGSDLLRKCILMFGDAVNILCNVNPWVERFVPMQQSDVMDLIRKRWLSLCDLPLSSLEQFDCSLKDLGLSLLDMSYLYSHLRTFGYIDVNIPVSKLVRTMLNIQFALFDEIDALSAKYT